MGTRFSSSAKVGAAPKARGRRKSVLYHADFVDVEPLRRLLLSGDLELVKASYLLECAKEGKPISRRQDLPERAFGDRAMIERMLGELEVLAEVEVHGAKRWHAVVDAHFPGIVVVSYAWATKSHPDPMCETLTQVLAPAIEFYMAERADYIRRGGFQALANHFAWEGWSSLGMPTLDGVDFLVFLDFMSMYQPPRLSDEDAAFGRALRKMDMLYAHQLTTNFRATRRLPSHTGLDYMHRGWPYFETCVCSLISGSYSVFNLGNVDWTRPIAYRRRVQCEDEMGAARATETGDEILVTFSGTEELTFTQLADKASFQSVLGTVGITGILKAGRRTPVHPDRFNKRLAGKVFTNASDHQTVMAMYANLCRKVTGGVEVLHFNDMGWSEPHAPAVAEVVLACPNLKRLNLSGNSWGPRGVAKLCDEFSKGAPTELTELHFWDSRAGDEGCAAVAKLIADGMLPKLQALILCRSHVGDAGFRALTAALEAFPTPVFVWADGNIDGEGKRELSRMQDRQAIEPGYVPQAVPGDGQTVCLAKRNGKAMADSRALVFAHAAQLAAGQRMPLTLSSHPGKAVVPLSEYPHMKFGEWSHIPVGVGPAELAITASLEGGFLACSPDERVLSTVNDELHVFEGSRLVFGRSIHAHPQRTRAPFPQTQFVLNGDGTLSPAARPELALWLLPELGLEPEWRRRRRAVV